MKHYEVCDSVFSGEECDRIIDYAENFPQVPGKVTSGLNRESRSSYIRWVPRSEQTSWIYDRVMASAWKANLFKWMFDINGCEEAFQFSAYGEDQYYLWHMDIGEREASLRKLSVSVQLSDPEDYDGGDLLLQSGRKPEGMSRNRGSVIIFPSYTLHSVSKVTRGRRCSLVLWITGARGYR